MSKGQIQIIFIIVAVLAVIGVVLGFQFFGGEKEKGFELGPEETVESPGDEGSPIRTELSPSGVLPTSTRETKLSVITNEPSYCRYSEKPDQSYDKMSKRFSYNKEKTQHVANISGLKNGQTYQYYVRCRDLAGNKNAEDVLIEFSVGGAGGSTGGSTTFTRPSEAPPIRGNLQPKGSLPGGISQTEMSLTTDEPAYCRYSVKPGQSFDSMAGRFSYDQEKLSHTTTVSGLEDNRTYEFYVRCRDMAGNKNDEDVIIRFGVGGVSFPPTPGQVGTDATPPYRYNSSPTGDLPPETRQTTISLKTDEKAFCRYSTVSGMSYESMTRLFTETGGTSQSVLVTGLDEGQEHKYFVRCIDMNNNKNANDFIISFKVKAPEDNIPPKRSNAYPSGETLPAGTKETMIGVSTDEPASCRYDPEAGAEYRSMSYSLSTDKYKRYHTATIRNLKDGQAYGFYVRCRDLAGNENTWDVLIHFNVGQ